MAINNSSDYQLKELQQSRSIVNSISVQFPLGLQD